MLKEIFIYFYFIYDQSEMIFILSNEKIHFNNYKKRNTMFRKKVKRGSVGRTCSAQQESKKGKQDISEFRQVWLPTEIVIIPVSFKQKQIENFLVLSNLFSILHINFSIKKFHIHIILFSLNFKPGF